MSESRPRRRARSLSRMPLKIIRQRFFTADYFWRAWADGPSISKKSLTLPGGGRILVKKRAHEFEKIHQPQKTMTPKGEAMKNVIVTLGAIGFLVLGVPMTQAVAQRVTPTADNPLGKAPPASAAATPEITLLVDPAHAETAVACTKCYTCGGDWPLFQGFQVNNTSSGNNTSERGASCSGPLGAVTSDAAPYMCCR
jgi:hypothetical protein